MFKRITTLVLLAGLLALPATAMGDNGGPGGPKTRFKFGSLRVHNAVDEAVEVASAGRLSPAILEPGETRTFGILLFDRRETVNVTANLVSDPSVSATASAELQDGKTTGVTVVYSGGTLSLEVQRPAKANGSKK